MALAPPILILDNDICLEAMSSWPRIESVELDDQQRYHPIVTTFCRLFAGLRLCPHLHALRVFMDAVNVDIDPKAGSFHHPPTNI